MQHGKIEIPVSIDTDIALDTNGVITNSAGSSVTFNQTVIGVTPTLPAHLTTKLYVDDKFANSIPEAPQDGITYGRKDGQWVDISTPLAGTTAQRPTTVYNGTEYFDTDLGYPIWWDDTNSQWVNSTGAPV